MITISPKPGSTDKYLLVGTHTFIIDYKEMTIPDGFEFDGATIPAIFWSTVGHPFSPRIVEAALVHDYLCVTDYDRHSANLKFKALLKEAGVMSLKASLMYGAVQLWGKISGAM